MAGKAISAKTGIRLNSTMNFCMSFEIMLPDEALLAVRTLILAIAKMGLNMRFDVFFTSESLLAIWKQTGPFLITIIRALDVTSNIINGDAGIGYSFCNIDIV
jgi:hypothetical protein